MLDPHGNHGYHRGFCGRKAKSLSEKLGRLLATTAICMAAAACSQIPWYADPSPADNEEPAAAPTVSAPAAQPASTAGVAPATAPAFVAALVAAPASVRGAES